MVQAAVEGDVVEVQYAGGRNKYAARDSTIDTAEKIAYFAPAVAATLAACFLARQPEWSELDGLDISTYVLALALLAFAVKRCATPRPPSKVLQKIEQTGRPKGSQREKKA
mmetsp:Transcript_20237/g.68553  ORF Transcript_20237/g.68553 Transcript_20237/m.68553 type:complete len:111 (+) Transcript_20237:87-419(+)|eukprot:CAMPEP_0184106664 /NCGR_PEP_ID=MMETSP0974-20121125/15491_1 /TAXON_ID=483370 /ORGANISM="non described non described, Strain CCMP2097" /LENGTH=110 /DNA_ID=CAMNT_0026409683 /DNA_START=18 /DNA_END=350 /DNA_ORIENTATION=-